MGLMWNPNEHSDDENVQWCWLRAVEWIRWPYFISQPRAPVMLLLWWWPTVVFIILLANLLWYFFVRPFVIILWVSQFGVYFVRLKWLVCPGMAIYFYSVGQVTNAWISLLWPVLIILIPLLPLVSLLALAVIPTAPIGPILKRFMMALGYHPRDGADALTGA
jgi:hypothetical protein